jgi:hypothetical protein
MEPTDMQSNDTSRRKFLKGTLAAGAGMAAGPLRRLLAQQNDSESGDMDEKLNVLFLFTDDQKADFIGALGNPHLKTPNMDRLAADHTCTYKHR